MGRCCRDSGDLFIFPLLGIIKNMLLSHKYKFIFIKTQKTAGTSMEISLSRYCGPDDIVTPFLNPEDEAFRRELNIFPRNDLVPLSKYRGREILKWLRGWRLRYWDHMPARQIKRFIGDEIYNTYYKFCFERNPWDKVISYYHWENRKNKYSSLDDFFSRKPLCTDYSKYTINGDIAVDFIGRYENLMDDLQTVCGKLGIPFDGWMPRAKANYRKDKRQYEDVLTLPQKEFIDRCFEKEIQLFHYTYGG